MYTLFKNPKDGQIFMTVGYDKDIVYCIKFLASCKSCKDIRLYQHGTIFKLKFKELKKCKPIKYDDVSVRHGISLIKSYKEFIENLGNQLSKNQTTSIPNISA